MIIAIIVTLFILTLLILNLGSYILALIFKLLAPQISSLFFGRISCQISLEDFSSFEQYVDSLNSNKKREINRILKDEYEILEIKEGKFQMSYLKNLWEFLGSKYHNLFVRATNMILSLLVFMSNQLSYWEYYHKDTNEFLGWSSYFIYNDVYYDFMSSPRSMNISTMAINSIKYSFQQKLKIVDLGPTNCQLKMSKFNAKLTEL
jgi:hypothetical protein